MSLLFLFLKEKSHLYMSRNNPSPLFSIFSSFFGILEYKHPSNMFGCHGDCVNEMILLSLNIQARLFSRSRKYILLQVFIAFV